MCFTDHIDVIGSKALVMLGFIRRVFGEFEDPHTPCCTQNLNMRVVCGLLFMMNTSTGLSECNKSLLDFHYVFWDRLISTIYLLMRTGVFCFTLFKRRTVAFILFVSVILLWRVSSSCLLSMIYVIALLWYLPCGVRWLFTAHNSSRTIHCGTIHWAQFTAGTIHRRHNLPRTIHCTQFTAHNLLQQNLPRIIHHKK
jgi:hypothetical protein